MKCYKEDGGCGPYEMLSCSECPASKPEYSRRRFANEAAHELGEKLASNRAKINMEKRTNNTNNRSFWKYLKDYSGGWSVYACPNCGQELRVPRGETPAYCGLIMCFSCHTVLDSK